MKSTSKLNWVKILAPLSLFLGVLFIMPKLVSADFFNQTFYNGYFYYGSSPSITFLNTDSNISTSSTTPGGITQNFFHNGFGAFSTSTAPQYFNSVSVQLKRGGSGTLTDYVCAVKSCTSGGSNYYDISTNTSNIVFGDIPTANFQEYKFSFDPNGACQLNNETTVFHLVNSTDNGCIAGGHINTSQNIYMLATTGGIRGGYQWSIIGQYPIGGYTGNPIFEGYALWFKLNSNTTSTPATTVSSICPSTDFNIDFGVGSVDFGQGICEITNFLTVPSQNKVNEWTNVKNNLETKIPFSYFYQVRDLLQTATSTPTSTMTTLTITTPTTSAISISVDMFSPSRIETYLTSTPRAIIRTAIQAALYLAFATMIFLTGRKLFKKQ